MESKNTESLETTENTERSSVKEQILQEYQDRLAKELPIIELRLNELSQEYEQLKSTEGYSQYQTLRGSLHSEERFLRNSLAIQEEINRATFLCSYLPNAEQAALLQRLNTIVPHYHHDWKSNKIRGVRLEILKAIPDTSPDGQPYRNDHPYAEKIKAAMDSVEQAMREIWNEHDEDLDNYHDYQNSLPQPTPRNSRDYENEKGVTSPENSSSGQGNNSELTEQEKQEALRTHLGAM